MYQAARSMLSGRLARGLAALSLVTLVAVPHTALGANACLQSINSGQAHGVGIQGHIGANPPNTQNESYAGTFNILIDNTPPTTLSYCVDLLNGIGIGDCNNQVPPTYNCKVVYILNNYYPNAARVLAVGREDAAIQAAIWHFTDNYNIDGPADIQARAQTIINAANAQSCVDVPVVPQSITVTPATANNILNAINPAADTHTVTATLIGTDSNPIPNYPITIQVTGTSGAQSFPGTTNGAGQFTVTYTNGFHVAGNDNIVASATFSVPVGLEFKQPGRQGIVLAGDPVTGTVTGTATKTWILPSCGDGIVNQGYEECDDGNAVNGDACDNNCTTPRCGNGQLDPTEACDDGNLAEGDTCDPNCELPGCGNGYQAANEVCDDGNQTNNDGCDTNCTVSSCGNGILDNGVGGFVQPPEECDDGNTVNGDTCDNNCTTPRCGNGEQSPNEQCDDGNNVSNDGCDANCTIPGCGNGIINTNPPNPEACDDGNHTNGDACENDCTLPKCGNGIQDQGEQCDDNNQNNNDTCKNDCTLNTCGDGVINATAGEQCDNGALNGTAGNACDVNCVLHEICNNLVDDDNDTFIDCDDPDCPECPPILKDPAVIKFRKLIDYVKIQGGVVVPNGASIAPGSDRFGFLFTNPNGVLFRQIISQGLPAAGTGFRSVNKEARKTGGIYKASLKLKQGIWHVYVRGYGSLEETATQPQMSAMVLIGDDIWASRAVWKKTNNGWKFEFQR